MKKERKKIHEIDETNDIRYRGPLTYQHLRIMAWIFLAVAQIGVLLVISGTCNDLSSSFMEQLGIGTATTSDSLINTGTFLHYAIELALPLFIIANFGVILSVKDSYKKLLIRFGVLSAVAVAVFFIFYEHFAVGLVASFNGDRVGAHDMVANWLTSDKGFFKINLFLDLFLCTLVMFFLNYTPKKVFTGNKLHIFRAFAILPIIYEAVSVALKIMAASGVITLSPFISPFLTTKPPIEFLAFIALAIFFKRRELHFLKNGKTKEDYKALLDTNTNSFHFATHAAIILAAAAVLDFILLCIISVIFAGAGGEGVTGEAIEAAVPRVMALGIGEAIPMLFIAPILLLYSYNKKPRFPNLDLPITLGGVVILFAVYLEGFFNFACMIGSMIGSLANQGI